MSTLQDTAARGQVQTWRLLWGMLRYKAALFALDSFFLVLMQATPLVPGLITRWFFDVLSGRTAAGLEPWSIAALLLVVALGRVVVILCAVSLDILHAFYVKSMLRRNMLEGVLDLPGTTALRQPLGEVLSGFREDPEHVHAVLTLVPDTAGAVLSSLVAVLILYRISPKLTLLVFGPLAMIVALAQSASNQFQKRRRASREATAKVTAAIAEAFGAVQAIKVARAEAPVRDNVDRLGEERRKAMLTEKGLDLLLESLEHGSATLGTGLVLLLSAQAMRAGSFSTGDFALFASYLTLVADYSVSFGMYIARCRQAAVAFERMATLLGGSPSERLVTRSPLYFAGKPGPEETGDGWPVREREPLELLSVSDLTCVHPKSGRGVFGVSFDVRGGELVIITGRMGSGKTTVLKALLGLLPAQAAHVLWNGHEVEPRAFFGPPHSAYTGQMPILFSGPVDDNILMGRKVPEGELEAAIRDAVFEQDVHCMESGMKTVVGAKGVRLSGGQVQRVAAARMLVSGAELLVMDDLSSALDVETENALWEHLSKRMDFSPAGRRVTCLATSNRRAALQSAHKVILMKDGRVLDQGTLSELLERCEEMRQLWAGACSTAGAMEVL